MHPLTFTEVSANEEASGRYFLRPRPTLDSQARTALLAAERHALFTCPLCGHSIRIARVFANPRQTDAQAYAMCWNCRHMEAI